MQLHNLDINILYRIYKELADRKSCGFLEADFIYQTYSDIPDENIAVSIQSLVAKGWLKEQKNQSQLYLTDSGRSILRAFIPAELWSTCEKKTEGAHQP